MTEIERKALALVNEVREERGYCDAPPYPADRKFPPFEALCRAIEQHEAFRQEVSDYLTRYYEGSVPALLRRFIIAKPDPLVEVMAEVNHMNDAKAADQLRAALAARGLKIVEDK